MGDVGHGCNSGENCDFTNYQCVPSDDDGGKTDTDDCNKDDDGGHSGGGGGHSGGGGSSKSGGDFPWLIIIIVAVAVTVIMIGLFVFMMKRSKEPPVADAYPLPMASIPKELEEEPKVATGSILVK